MPARKLPPNYELAKMYRSGMSHQEMADQISEEIGEPVTRVAITLALSRIGVEPRQARYSKRIPWRVSSKHRNEAAVRMLRLLGRRDLDPKALPQSEAERLDGWLAWPTALTARRASTTSPRKRATSGRSGPVSWTLTSSTTRS